uniref:BTB domain-containing protein n=1 Tax=Panagrolaimus sp. PS1159 TaxID=55785 RepID=A0AC35EW11_9BILA
MNQDESVKDLENGLKECLLSNELAESDDGGRKFGTDISNLPVKRNRTRTYKFFDGTTHNNIHFKEKLKKPSKKRNITFENDGVKDVVPKKRGRKSNVELRNSKEGENESGVSECTRTEKPSHPITNASTQRSRTEKFGVKTARTAQNQRTRTVVNNKAATTTTPKQFQQTHGETGECVDSERNTPAPRTRTEKASHPVTTPSTSTEKPSCPTTSSSKQRSRTDKPAIKATQTRTSKMQRTRTEKPIIKRAEAIPIQPERTRGGSRNSNEIVLDRKIEGQCRIFDVNTTMLSQKSATFKQLFEVNMNESIFIEGKFIEEQMVQQMTPENVVIYANAAVSSHSEIVVNACKDLILKKFQNHESVQNISKLDDRLRDEIIHLQYNQAY